MLHLWRNKEEIQKAADEIERLIELASHRRLLPSERLTLLAELENIRSWTSDLPEQVSVWASFKSLFQ